MVDIIIPFALCLLQLVVLTRIAPLVSAKGLYVLSEQTSNFAMGGALNLYQINGEKGVIISGISTIGPTVEDTKCYIGTIYGSDQTVHLDGNQMCLSFELFSTTQQSSQSSPDGDAPNGIVAAMDEHEHFLIPLNYNQDQSGFDLSSFVDSAVKLPSERYPAVMTSDNNIGLYVALHDTAAITWNFVATFSSHEKVKTLQNYFRTLEYPYNEQQIYEAPMIYKYDMSSLNQAISNTNKQPVWQQELTTTDGKTLITAMETVPSRNRLVVVGSTTGQGEKIGAGAIGGKGNWDGYLTLVNMDTGIIDTHTSGTYDAHSIRIRSQMDEDDLVLGLCHEKAEDGKDEEKVYVVGSTSGRITGDDVGGAFVVKIDIDTNNVIWKKQFSGTNVGAKVGEHIEATRCDVVGNNLYVGGMVPAGLQVENGSATSDTVDIFAALLDATLGDIKFLRQIDCQNKDDQLVAMEIDPPTGDVYLTSNAMDFEADTTQVYVLSVNSQGEHALINEVVPLEEEKRGDDDKEEKKSGDDDDKEENIGTFISPATGKSSSGSGLNGAVIAILIVLTTISLSIVGYFFYQKKKLGKQELEVRGKEDAEVV